MNSVDHMPAEYYYYCKSASNTVDDHTDSIINGRPDHTDKKTKTEIKAHYGKD